MKDVTVTGRTIRAGDRVVWASKGTYGGAGVGLLSLGLLGLLAQACISIPDIDTAGCIEECRLELTGCSDAAGEVECAEGDACLDEVEDCFDEANECSKDCTGCEDEPGNDCRGTNSEADCADLCTDAATVCTDMLQPCIDQKESCVRGEIDAEKTCLSGRGGFVDCTGACIHEVETKLKNIG